MDYLNTKYACIQQDNIEKNILQMMEPINGDMPMAMHFKHTQDIMDLGEAGNQSLDQATLVTTVYIMMKNVGVCDWDIRTCEDKQEADKTFDKQELYLSLIKLFLYLKVIPLGRNRRIYIV